MEKVSRAISVLLHPLLVPTIGMLVLYNSGTYLAYVPFEMKKWLLVMVFIATFVIPLAFIPFFFYQKLIMSIHLSQRQERYFPLAISLLLYFFCYYMVRRVAVPQLYHAFILSGFLSILITMLLTMKFKISIHMVGGGGLVALISFIAFYLHVNLLSYLILAVLGAGIVGTARLQLKAHSEGEVYIGFLTGFTVVLLTLWLY